VGRYVVYQYQFRGRTGMLYAGDWSARAMLEIQPGQTTAFEVGPPLKMSIDTTWAWTREGDGPPKRNRLDLEVWLRDRAGRRVSGLRTLKGREPPAPRFKIVDMRGNVLQSGAFEYG